MITFDQILKEIKTKEIKVFNEPVNVKMTTGNIEKTKDAIKQTQKLIDKEMKYSEENRKKDYLEQLNNHMKYLKDLLK